MYYWLTHEDKQWKWYLRTGFEIPDGSIVRIIDGKIHSKSPLWVNSKVPSVSNHNFNSVIWFNEPPSTFHDQFLIDTWSSMLRSQVNYSGNEKIGFVILPDNSVQLCSVEVDHIFPIEFSEDVDMIKIHSRQRRIKLGKDSIRVDDILFIDNMTLYSIVNNMDFVVTAQKIPVALLKLRNGKSLLDFVKKDRVENDTTEAEDNLQKEWEELERNA